MAGPVDQLSSIRRWIRKFPLFFNGQRAGTGGAAAVSVIESAKESLQKGLFMALQLKNR
jgi:hypothetical protein